MMVLLAGEPSGKAGSFCTRSLKAFTLLFISVCNMWVRIRRLRMGSLTNVIPPLVSPHSNFSVRCHKLLISLIDDFQPCCVVKAGQICLGHDRDVEKGALPHED